MPPKRARDGAAADADDSDDAADIMAASARTSATWPLLAGCVKRDGTMWSCLIPGCSAKGNNDGADKSGASNALSHVLSAQHVKDAPDDVLAHAYRKTAGTFRTQLAVLKKGAKSPAEFYAALQQKSLLPQRPTGFNSEASKLVGQGRNAQLGALANALAEGLVASSLPLNIVESDFVGRLVHFTLGPDYPLPSRRTVSSRLAPIFDKWKAERDVALKGLLTVGKEASLVLASSRFAFTTDVWSATPTIKKDAYLVITLHYFDDNMDLHDMPLAFFPFPKRHRAENIFKLLKEAFTSPERGNFLPSHIGIGTTDNASSMISAMTMLTGMLKTSLHSSLTPAEKDIIEYAMTCDIHTLQLAMRTAVKEITDVKEMYATEARVKKVFNNARLRMEALEVACKARGIDFHGFVFGCATRWTTMTEGFASTVALTPAILDIPTSTLQLADDKAKMAWSDDKDKWRMYATSTSTGRCIASDVITVLQPCADYTTYAQGARYITSSRSLSKIGDIRSTLTSTGRAKELHETAIAYASALLREVNSRFDMPSATYRKNLPLRSAATMLDPETHATLNPHGETVAEKAAVKKAEDAAMAANKPKPLPYDVPGGPPRPPQVTPSEGNRNSSSYIMGTNYICAMAKHLLAKLQEEREAKTAAAPPVPAVHMKPIELMDFNELILNGGSDAAPSASSAAFSPPPFPPYKTWFINNFVCGPGGLLEAARRGETAKTFWLRISTKVNGALSMTPELDYLAVTLTTARAVLAMQASSAASERGGSVLTRLITPERTWLLPATVEKLALLRSWLRSKWARKPRYRVVQKTAEPAANAGAGAAAAAAPARTYDALEADARADNGDDPEDVFEAILREVDAPGELPRGKLDDDSDGDDDDDDSVSSDSSYVVLDEGWV
jgi:hypothetical protein